VKSAYENHDQRVKLEYFAPDIVQVTARYLEVDGDPFVLELLQRMHSDTIIDPDDTEALFSAISGYNTKLYHDALTDVYNRRYYEEIVRGMKGPTGVALMDLDDFKVYNDTYGHHAGDLALETVAKAIRSCIRETDLLIRYARRRVFAGAARHSERHPASQAGADQSRRAAGYCTRLFAFSPLTEHRRNDAGHHRPDGECGSPCRLADVSGKGPQECRYGGGSGA